MKQFIIQNKEVFVVNYLVEAEDEAEAMDKWLEDECMELNDPEYLTELATFVNSAVPMIIEVQ